MANISFSIKYNETVAKGVKKQMSQEIVDAVEGSSALRAEIRKTFQQANRRIQNIEKSGVYSPAVAALGKQSVKGYSKFSVKGFGNSGESWNDLKKEYAKAISFLQSPTSTATGARQWSEQVQSQLGLDKETFENAVNNLMNDYNSVSDSFVSLVNYSSMIQDIYDSAMQDESRQLENDAIQGADELEKSIEKQAQEIAGNAIDEIKQGLENSFKM